MKYKSLKNMTEEEIKARKRKQKAEAQRRYYQRNKDYYKNYAKNWSIQKQKEMQQEIERLNNIIDELEKWLNDRSEFTNIGEVLNKLNELKEK